MLKRKVVAKETTILKGTGNLTTQLNAMTILCIIIIIFIIIIIIITIIVIIIIIIIIVIHGTRWRMDMSSDALSF